MKFSTNQDIEAPIERVFQAISDFDTFERSALRRGAEVGRTEPKPDSDEKIRWDMVFKFKGKKRELVAMLEEFDAPNGLKVAGGTGGLQGDVIADLLPLSKTRTRLSLTIDLQAHTLTGRLLLQSLKLMRGRLNDRLQTRVEKFVKQLERNKGFDHQR